MATRLVSEVVGTDQVSFEERQSLYRLFESCYDVIDFDQFCTDFAEKDHVLLLRDTTNQKVRGFSTQKVECWEIAGQKIRTVFSGDTIVHPDFWGEQELVRGWCRYASWIRSLDDGAPLHWLLISKGFRTYLYLSLFCRCFCPHYNQTDETLLLKRDTIASQKFGETFDKERGVLSFASSQGQLKPSFAEIPEKRRDHPHVAYFLQSNPGYVSGDELVCLAELSDRNVRSIAGRYFKEPQAPRLFC